MPESQRYAILTDLGNALLTAGGVDEAIARYGEARAIQPDEPRAIIGAALCRHARGEHQLAVDAAADALKAGGICRFILAESEFANGNHARSAAIGADCAREHPDDLAGYIAWLQAAAMLPDEARAAEYAKMERHLEAYLRRHPGTAAVADAAKALAPADAQRVEAYLA